MTVFNDEEYKSTVMLRNAMNTSLFHAHIYCGRKVESAALIFRLQKHSDEIGRSRCLLSGMCR